MQNYTKQAACMLSLLLLIPGCMGGGRKKDMKHDKKTKKSVCREIDVPVADSQVAQNFFDDEEDAQDFALDEDNELVDQSARYAQAMAETDTGASETTQFAWVEDNIQEDDQAQETFRTVYFDFDGSRVREDQKEAMEYNAQLAKRKIAQAGDHQVKIVIDGHACHSAGTPAYNLAISQRRARALRDYFVSMGIPAENLTIVGRGDEMPALADGQKVSGNRQEQWPNRRGELHVLYS